MQLEALHLKHCHDSLSRMPKSGLDRFKHDLQCQISHESQQTPENSTCLSHDPQGKTFANLLVIIKCCKDTTLSKLQMINNVRVESMVHCNNKSRHGKPVDGTKISKSNSMMNIPVF